MRQIPLKRAAASYCPVAASGVQVADQRKRARGGSVGRERRCDLRSGVKTDIVCAGQRRARRGRVPLSPSRDSE